MADDGTPSMVEDDTSPPVEETNTGPAGGGKEHQLIFLLLGCNSDASLIWTPSIEGLSLSLTHWAVCEVLGSTWPTLHQKIMSSMAICSLAEKSGLCRQTHGSGLLFKNAYE
jgi:hypothetical protein